MRMACVLSEGFEDPELRVPYDKLRAGGHEITVIGAKKGERITGKQGKQSVEADASIDDVRPESFGARFIPGGHSPDQLRGTTASSPSRARSRTRVRTTMGDRPVAGASAGAARARPAREGQ